MSQYKLEIESKLKTYCNLVKNLKKIIKHNETEIIDSGDQEKIKINNLSGSINHLLSLKRKEKDDEIYRLKVLKDFHNLVREYLKITSPDKENQDNDQTTETLENILIDKIEFETVGQMNEVISKEKHDELIAIQSDLQEINLMIKDLAPLVIEQGQILTTVAFNVETTENQTEKALNELSIAREYDSRSCKK